MAFAGQVSRELDALLARFRELHVAARAGVLPAARRADYEAARDDLARTLLATQRVNLQPGETPRSALRVNRALFVDLYLGQGWSRGTTLDVSPGGFALHLTGGLPVGEAVAFQLYPTERDVVAGYARATRVKPEGPGLTRVSFAFQGLTPPAAEILERLVFDTVLLLWGDTAPDSRRAGR